MKRPVITLVIAMLMVSSVVAPAAVATEHGDPPPGFVTTGSEIVNQTVDPENGPPTGVLKQQTDLAPGQSGPPMQALGRMPDQARKSVMASRGSITVQWAPTPDGDPALVVTDDNDSSSARVAIPVSAFKETMGKVPERAFGYHEDGSTWAAEVKVEGGYAIIKIPHFSTNIITFNGEFNLNASPASDGDQFTYDSPNGGENLAINVTGSTHSVNESEVASGLNNQSMTLSVAGNAPPTGPSSNGEPTVTFTGIDGKHNPFVDEGDGGANDYDWVVGSSGSTRISASIEWTAPVDGEITELILQITRADGADYGPTVDVRIHKSGADSTYGEGTLIADNWDPAWSSGSQTVTTNTGYTVTKGTTYEIEFITNSNGGNNVDDALAVDLDSSPSTVNFHNRNSGNRNAYGDMTVELNGGNTKDPAIDLDGDGTTDASVSGSVSPGSSVTKELSSLSTDTTNATVTTTNGAVDVNISYTERTKTVDPVVELNGNTTSYTGTLADGSTVSLSANDSWIANGTNQVNVSVGNGTLSADAPTPQVTLDYKHDIPEKKSVNYKAEKFTERYNVSKTWAEDTQNANLTINWASGRVVKIRDITVYRNGSKVSNPDYTMNNGNLKVNFGTVKSGATTRVVANGSKVKVSNGKIKVLDATGVGKSLDTKIEVTSKSSGFNIALGTKKNGNLIHYTYNESWSGADTYAVMGASGNNKLYMPDAAAGSTTRISTIPVSVDPATGDVKVEVDNPSSTEPSFRVEPGPNAKGDEVDFTFINAKDNTDYILYSLTNDVVLDSGTANSPITLTDDDSSETLEFQVDDSDGGSGGGGGGGGGGGAGPITAVTNAGAGLLPILGIGGIGLFAFVIITRRVFGTDVSEQVTEETSQRDGIVGRIIGFIVGGMKAVLVGISQAIVLVAKKGGAALRSAAGNQTARRVTAGAVVVALFTFDIITLTSGERTLAIVIGGLVGAFLLLKRAGRFSWPLYSVIATASIIMGITALGSDVVTAFIESPIFPVLGLGGLFIAWKLIKSWQKSQRPVIKVDGDDQ